MIGRVIILVSMVLFGPLFIEVCLYHPVIAREHDLAAVVPLVASPLALFGGFLLLAIDNRLTAALFVLICAIEIMVGVTGAAIHIAMHWPDSLTSLVTDPTVWFGEPPPLVPLSFAAAGCLALIPLVRPGLRTLPEPPITIARLLYALAAACGLVAALAATLTAGADIALLATIAALCLGPFGFAAEILVLACVWWRGASARA